jgi:carboxymethylenebutenolidase
MTHSTGSAQEANPIRALDDPDIHREDVTYLSHGTGAAVPVQAFLATPTTEGKRGAVLVIHEIFGLTDHIKDVACRLAQAGYDALAVNMFTREGEPPSLSGGFEPLRAFVGSIPDSQIMSDLDAGAAYLQSRPGSNGKVGIVGFCWGGRVSMLFAAQARHLDAAVAYYGRINSAPTENQPASPMDLAEKMHAPLMGHFGGEDQGIPESDVHALQSTLEQYGKTAEIYVYPGAGHAFNNDTRPSYHAETAAVAWQRTLEWFRKYLAS